MYVAASAVTDTHTYKMTTVTLVHAPKLNNSMTFCNVVSVANQSRAARYIMNIVYRQNLISYGPKLQISKYHL